MAQEHFDRLTAIDASFLAQEGPTSHMHIGALTRARGPAAAVRRVPGHHPRAPAPRPALPPAAQLPARRERPAGVGRRPELQPRVPRAPDRAAAARNRGAALQARLTDLLPAARPLEAALGDVGDRGPRGRPLGADLQDAPLGHRRDLRRRPRDGHVRPHAGAARGRASGRGVEAVRRADVRRAGRVRRRRRRAHRRRGSAPPRAAWRRTRRRSSPRSATASRASARSSGRA